MKLLSIAPTVSITISSAPLATVVLNAKVSLNTVLTGFIERWNADRARIGIGS